MKILTLLNVVQLVLFSLIKIDFTFTQLRYYLLSSTNAI